MKPKRLCLYLSEEDHTRLKVAVAAHGKTFQEAVVPNIRDLIERLEATKPTKAA